MFPDRLTLRPNGAKTNFRLGLFLQVLLVAANSLLNRDRRLANFYTTLQSGSKNNCAWCRACSHINVHRIEKNQSKGKTKMGFFMTENQTTINIQSENISRNGCQSMLHLFELSLLWQIIWSYWKNLDNFQLIFGGSWRLWISKQKCNIVCFTTSDVTAIHTTVVFGSTQTSRSQDEVAEWEFSFIYKAKLILSVQSFSKVSMICRAIFRIGGSQCENVWMPPPPLFF